MISFLKFGLDCAPSCITFQRPSLHRPVHRAALFGTWSIHSGAVARPRVWFTRIVTRLPNPPRWRVAAGHSQGRSFDDRSNSRLTGPHTSWNVAWTVNECAQLANARLCALNSTTLYRVLDKSRVFSKCHWRIELPLQASLRIPYLKLRFRGPWVCGSRFEERQVIGQRPAMRRAAPGSVPPTHHSIDGGRHAVHPSFRGPGAARAQNP